MPTLSSQHYEHIARVFRTNQPDANDTAAWIQQHKLCEQLADSFAKDNLRFNKNIFMLKCGFVAAESKPTQPPKQEFPLFIDAESRN